jgi:hypothetical protein
LTEDPEVSVFLRVGPPGIRIPAAFPQPFKTRQDLHFKAAAPMRHPRPDFSGAPLAERVSSTPPTDF